MLKKYFYYTLPLLYILGGLSHFIYNICSNYFIIGLFFPVNESIYEHTKLCFIPLLLFYLYGYLKFKPIKEKWWMCFSISLFISILLIPILYYTYTGAFGFENTIIDIIIFFVSITIAQLISLDYYNHIKTNSKLVPIILLSTYIIFSILFTINPPKLPLFIDPINNTYGIQKRLEI